MANIKIGKWTIPLPASVLARRLLGVGLIILGILGFLPILGFWMVPLGLLVLSVDSNIVRRARRRMAVGLGRWLVKRYPRAAQALGYQVD